MNEKCLNLVIRTLVVRRVLATHDTLENTSLTNSTKVEHDVMFDRIIDLNLFEDLRESFKIDEFDFGFVLGVLRLLSGEERRCVLRCGSVFRVLRITVEKSRRSTRRGTFSVLRVGCTERAMTVG